MIDYDEYMAVFNADAAIDHLVETTREWFRDNAPSNAVAVVGISGGKDSSVVAALLCEALGKERVVGVLMPNGDQLDIDDAKELCNFLGIKYFIHNISNEYEDVLRGVWCNLIEDDELISGQAKINLAPRLRMAVLYAYSQSLVGRVACTDNLSESYIGYSTQWGDNVGDFAPIANYTSDEVVAIGRALGLPKHLVEKAPSDGLCGLTDEDNLGFTYRVLNEYIRLNQIEDKAAQMRIDYLHELNAFKRKPIVRF